MPSTELDDLMVIAEHISSKIDPVKYQVAQAAKTNHIDEVPQLFLVQRYDGPGGHWKTIFTGLERTVRAFLNGMAEGRCATLRRW